MLPIGSVWCWNITTHICPNKITPLCSEIYHTYGSYGLEPAVFLSILLPSILGIPNSMSRSTHLGAMTMSWTVPCWTIEKIVSFKTKMELHPDFLVGRHILFLVWGSEFSGKMKRQKSGTPIWEQLRYLGIFQGGTPMRISTVRDDWWFTCTEKHGASSTKKNITEAAFLPGFFLNKFQLLLINDNIWLS